MSHFYGTLRGARGPATRTGTKGSGLNTQAAGWRGAINTELWHDREADVDRYRVTLIPWQGSGGTTKVLAEGILDAQDSE